MTSLLVIEVEGHGVADKVLSTGLETELCVDSFHSIHVKVNT